MSDSKVPYPSQQTFRTRADGSLRLLGFDFGSTTSSMMLAEVSAGHHSLSGRSASAESRLAFQSTPVFTPFNDQQLDENAVRGLLQQWLHEAGWFHNASMPSASAAMITGLAARNDNAGRLRHIITDFTGDSLIAAADDPGLESWLAFMGSCATLSRDNPKRTIVNLDIGGGTTNAAKGINGQVSDCGCFYIGARHFIFRPGTYELISYSHFGSILLQYLRIEKTISQTLNSTDISLIVNFYIYALESIAMADMQFFSRSPLHQRLLQMPFTPTIESGTHPLITFSGGIGELIYRYLQEGYWPAQTLYGDLGIDLARGIVASPVLSSGLSYHPEHSGRVTLLGQTLHSCDIPGNRLYLSHPQQLPLKDLPVISQLNVSSADDDWQKTIHLACSAHHGACIVIEQTDTLDNEGIKQLAQTIRSALQSNQYPLTQPLVLLPDSHCSELLGQYLTDQGKENRSLIVINEIPLRGASFVHIGRLRNNIVPVSFFAMN